MGGPCRAGLTRRHSLRLGLGLAAAIAAPAWAGPRASAWPQRPLRLVVGFPGGSSADEIARTLAEPLGVVLGQPVLVDNRQGHSGLLAAQLVAHSDDDHTLGLLLNLHLTVAPWLHADAGYDPARDVQPVALAASTPLLLCLNPDLHVRGAPALQAARRAGAAWRYGSPGVGSPFHLAMELLKASAGWQTEGVAYPGNAQVVNALLAGEVHLAMLPPALVRPLWRLGKLPVLGGTGPGVAALLPGVPVLESLGVRGFQYDHWYALAAPRGWPAAHVERVGRAVRLALRTPAVQAALQRQGWLPGSGDTAALLRRIDLFTQRLRPLLETAPWRGP
ncbi:Bug family tripartite tricarboxylate transporter substrate binding protein [Tepidimonas ignava]|uniref:Bug family tripartite tricarboxylate transporter substrate binding protein n=1 Tax=Tepidimonas ignava TaxID=114249 RepID=UPI002FD9B35F